MILGYFQALSVSASKPRASGDDPHEVIVVTPRWE